MRTYVLTHLSDAVLLHDLSTLVARERTATAAVLAHIAEVDARRLYLPAGFPSMFAYCVGRLRLSEDAAYKRIQAGRTARQFPVLFEALADGRLHLTGLGLLAPRLTAANVDELLALSSHKTKAEIEVILAERFPGNERLELVEVISSTRPGPASARLSGDEANGSSRLGEVAPAQAANSESSRIARIGEVAPAQVGDNGTLGFARPGELGPIHATNDEAKGRARLGELAPPQVTNDEALGLAKFREVAPAQVAASEPPSRVKPLAAKRYAVTLTIDEEGYELLRYAQALLSHHVAAGDLGRLFVHALRQAVERAEGQKFGQTYGPRMGPHRESPDPRHIPARVKRAVYERDDGRCTFVSEDGHRCASRVRLEFDHIRPVARGGRANLENLRLRCRGHNQYEAERAFGADFMRARRQAARRDTPATALGPASGDGRGAGAASP